MNAKYILFDLDGTLLDTSVGILKALDYVVQQLGLEKADLEVKKTFIGPPIYEAFDKYYHMDETECDHATEMFRNAYKDQFLFEAIPYEGIYELLGYLKEKGYKLGVATNKRNDYAIRLLEQFHFDQYFDYMLGTDFENKMKKADVIKVCLEKIGCTQKEYSKAVIVGDTIHDYRGAQIVGIGFVGVSYGFGFRTEDDYRVLTGEKVFEKVGDLKKYFDK